jgi:hypothetical protein
MRLNFHDYASTEFSHKCRTYFVTEKFDLKFSFYFSRTKAQKIRKEKNLTTSVGKEKSFIDLKKKLRKALFYAEHNGKKEILIKRSLIIIEDVNAFIIFLSSGGRCVWEDIAYMCNFYRTP